MADQKLSVKDFAAKIKAKYPDYAGIDDAELTKRIIEKYPQYAETVQLETPIQQPEQKTAVQRFGSGVYDVTVQPLKDIYAHHQENVKKYGDFMSTIHTAFDLGKGLIKGANDQGVEALQELFKGNVGEFVRHAPGIVPGVGPAAVNASKRMDQGDVAGGLGEAAGLIGTAYAGPKVSGIAKGAARGAARMAGGTAEKLYQSALKPGPGTYSLEETARMVKTGLDEGIPVSPGGAEKINSAIRSLNEARGKIVESAPKPEVTFTPKMQPKRLAAGAREMPPSSTESGTTQAVLDKADISPSGPIKRGKFSDIPDYEQRANTVNYTQENRNPAQASAKLDQAKNAQLIEVINERAQKSGLLQAVQKAALESGQPVPASITDIYDVGIKNVIFPKDVARRIDGLIERFQSVNPDADLAAMRAAKTEFLENYPNPLTLKQAQKLKSTTYRVIGDRPYMDKATRNAASVEAEQALARGLMEELAEQVPAIKAINARETKFFGLKPALEQAVKRIKNWEVFGLQTPLVGGAVGVLSGSPEAGAAAAAIAAILRDPNLKSRLAIAIHKAAVRDGKKLSIGAAKTLIEDYGTKIGRAAAAANISLSGLPVRQQQNEQAR